MLDNHYLELFLAACNVGVIFVNLSINAKLADMKATMYEKFLTKEDFSKWTQMNSQLANFKGSKI
jgi:hypothetical protein